MKKVLVYCRVSTKGQIRGSSLSRQRDICRDYAIKKGYEIVGAVFDVCSGTTMDRPGVNYIREVANLGVFDVIVVEATDRWTRTTNVDDYGLSFSDVPIEYASEAERKFENELRQIVALTVQSQSLPPVQIGDSDA